MANHFLMAKGLLGQKCANDFRWEPKILMSRIRFPIKLMALLN